MATTSSASRPPEVLIVGAGPVGLTAAAELARHGVAVRIVDRRTGPVKYSQAAAVHVRMQEILGAMGIVQGWLDTGHPLERVSIRAFGKKLGVVHPGGIDSPYPRPLFIGQNVTERLLVEHLERLGVQVERQVEATAFSQDADGVSVTLRHLADSDREEMARVPWLVACEGSSSKAREAAGIPFEGARYSGTEFVQADVRVHWSLPDGSGYSFIGKDRTLLMLPFDGAGHYRVLCIRPETPDANHEPPTLEEMQTIARELTDDPGLRLSDPLWLSHFRTQHRLAGRFREGRIFLAGDAGHVHVPVGGQGMNYGVQDAFNLAWKLGAVVRGDARPEPFLDSYHAERYLVDEQLLHGTDSGFRAMASPGAWTSLAMRFLGPTALGLETVQARARIMLSGTQISYAGSVLAETHGHGDGPKGGDRAPDAPVVKLPEQETVSLFSLIYPSGRWTLLLFGGLEPTENICRQLAQVRQTVVTGYARLIDAHFVLTDLHLAATSEIGPVLLDREHTAHEKYGVKTAGIYLIRPDGYVGFRGGLDTAGQLTAYLDRIGLVKAT